MSDNANQTQPAGVNPVAADLAWDDFVRAAKAFAPYLDQWEKVTFPTDLGTVYLSIGRKDPYPDSFEAIP